MSWSSENTHFVVLKEREDEMVRLDALLKRLATLPVLDDRCAECGKQAVVCDPASRRYLCAHHAGDHARSHPLALGDIHMAAHVRATLLYSGTRCTLCEKIAMRYCIWCGSPVCYHHIAQIGPRISTMCHVCATEAQTTQMHEVLAKV